MDFGQAPWSYVAQLVRSGPLVLQPLGSIEAHGPHLPLDTDTRLAVGLAERCAPPLRARGTEVMVAPPITATASSYAAAFPGTVSIAGETERQVVVETVHALLRWGASRVVLVNLHFDPEHLAAVKAAMAELEAEHPGRTLFPDFTRRVHAQALGGEFATGSCHAGEFETSLLLALAPEAVGEFRALPPREVDLAKAIREGKHSFGEVGLDQAYCGHPATASAEEGERLLGILTAIVLYVTAAGAAAAPR